MMCECPECGHKASEEDKMFECPYCGKDDYGEGYYECENCGALFDWAGDLWICPYCKNEGETPEIERNFCPCCGAELDDDVCFECGWPDVNQGWVGENYG